MNSTNTNTTNTTSAQTGAEGVAAPDRTPAAVIPENTSAPDDGADARRALLRAILHTLPLDVRGALLAAVLQWALSMRAAAGVLQCTTGGRARRVARTTIEAARCTLEIGALELGAESHVNAMAAVWFGVTICDSEGRSVMDDLATAAVCAPDLSVALADVEALDATVAAAVSVRDAWRAEGVSIEAGLRAATTIEGMHVPPLAFHVPGRDGAATRWFLRDDVRAVLAAATSDPAEHLAPCGHRMAPRGMGLDIGAVVVAATPGAGKTADVAEALDAGAPPPVRR